LSGSTRGAGSTQKRGGGCWGHNSSGGRLSGSAHGGGGVLGDVGGSMSVLGVSGSNNIAVEPNGRLWVVIGRRPQAQNDNGLHHCCRLKSNRHAKTVNIPSQPPCGLEKVTAGATAAPSSRSHAITKRDVNDLQGISGFRCARTAQWFATSARVTLATDGTASHQLAAFSCAHTAHRSLVCNLGRNVCIIDALSKPQTCKNKTQL